MRHAPPVASALLDLEEKKRDYNFHMNHLIESKHVIDTNRPPTVPRIIQYEKRRTRIRNQQIEADLERLQLIKKTRELFLNKISTRGSDTSSKAKDYSQSSLVSFGQHDWLKDLQENERVLNLFKKKERISHIEIPRPQSGPSEPQRVIDENGMVVTDDAPQPRMINVTNYTSRRCNLPSVFIPAAPERGQAAKKPSKTHVLRKLENSNIRYPKRRASDSPDKSRTGLGAEEYHTKNVKSDSKRVRREEKKNTLARGSKLFTNALTDYSSDFEKKYARKKYDSRISESLFEERPCHEKLPSKKSFISKPEKKSYQSSIKSKPLRRNRTTNEVPASSGSQTSGSESGKVDSRIGQRKTQDSNRIKKETITAQKTSADFGKDPFNNDVSKHLYKEHASDDNLTHLHSLNERPDVPNISDIEKLNGNNNSRDLQQYEKSHTSGGSFLSSGSVQVNKSSLEAHKKSNIKSRTTNNNNNAEPHSNKGSQKHVTQQDKDKSEAPSTRENLDVNQSKICTHDLSKLRNSDSYRKLDNMGSSTANMLSKKDHDENSDNEAQKRSTKLTNPSDVVIDSQTSKNGENNKHTIPNNENNSNEELAEHSSELNDRRQLGDRAVSSSNISEDKYDVAASKIQPEGTSISLKEESVPMLDLSKIKHDSSDALGEVDNNGTLHSPDGRETNPIKDYNNDLHDQELVSKSNDNLNNKELESPKSVSSGAVNAALSKSTINKEESTGMSKSHSYYTDGSGETLVEESYNSESSLENRSNSEYNQYDKKSGTPESDEHNKGPITVLSSDKELDDGQSSEKLRGNLSQESDHEHIPHTIIPDKSERASSHSELIAQVLHNSDHSAEHIDRSPKSEDINSNSRDDYVNYQRSMNEKANKSGRVRRLSSHDNDKNNDCADSSHISQRSCSPHDSKDFSLPDNAKYSSEKISSGLGKVQEFEEEENKIPFKDFEYEQGEVRSQLSEQSVSLQHLERSSKESLNLEKNQELKEEDNKKLNENFIDNPNENQSQLSEQSIASHQSKQSPELTAADVTASNNPNYATQSSTNDPSNIIVSKNSKEYSSMSDGDINSKQDVAQNLASSNDTSAHQNNVSVSTALHPEVFDNNAEEKEEVHNDSLDDQLVKAKSVSNDERGLDSNAEVEKINKSTENSSITSKSNTSAQSSRIKENTNSIEENNTDKDNHSKLIHDGAHEVQNAIHSSLEALSESMETKRSNEDVTSQQAHPQEDPFTAEQMEGAKEGGKRSEANSMQSYVSSKKFSSTKNSETSSEKSFHLKDNTSIEENLIDQPHTATPLHTKEDDHSDDFDRENYMQENKETLEEINKSSITNDTNANCSEKGTHETSQLSHRQEVQSGNSASAPEGSGSSYASGRSKSRSAIKYSTIKSKLSISDTLDSTFERSRNAISNDDVQNLSSSAKESTKAENSIFVEVIEPKNTDRKISSEDGEKVPQKSMTSDHSGHSKVSQFEKEPFSNSLEDSSRSNGSERIHRTRSSRTASENHDRRLPGEVGEPLVASNEDLSTSSHKLNSVVSMKPSNNDVINEHTNLTEKSDDSKHEKLDDTASNSDNRSKQHETDTMMIDKASALNDSEHLDHETREAKTVANSFLNYESGEILGISTIRDSQEFNSSSEFENDEVQIRDFDAEPDDQQPFDKYRVNSEELQNLTTPRNSDRDNNNQHDQSRTTRRSRVDPPQDQLVSERSVTEVSPESTKSSKIESRNDSISSPNKSLLENGETPSSPDRIGLGESYELNRTIRSYVLQQSGTELKSGKSPDTDDQSFDHSYLSDVPKEPELKDVVSLIKFDE